MTLSSAKLRAHTPDDAALVLLVALHVEVAVVRYGEYVRRHLAYLLIGVEADLVRGVDGQQLVGIDRDQDGAGVRLREAKKITPESWAPLALKGLV